MSNQRLLSVTIEPEVQSINNDGPRKKNHQSKQIKKESINQSIKEDTQKPTDSTSKATAQVNQKKKQPSGEGWWVKPVDRTYVETVRTPKCSENTTTTKANPPNFFYFLRDDEE